MTDTCATCRYYVSGDCRLEPPLPGATRNLARQVTSDFWCGEFSSGTPGDRTPYNALAMCPAGAGVAMLVAKADGTLWYSVTAGPPWVQVTGP